MKLAPFEAVGDTKFSLTEDELVSRLGRPVRSTRNNVGLNELDYGAAIYRFQDSGRLEEITQRAPVLNIGAIAVPFASLKAFVEAQDPEAFERAGFTVSPKFGIAFSPDSSNWVTALARHCLPEWRSL